MTLRSLRCRRALHLGSLAVLAAAAHAQTVLPMPTPARDAGVYHLATGAWTRKASSASLGASTVYDNTCASGYYSAQTGTVFVDEGRLPSPTSASFPGCATSYQIDGFTLSYCTDQPSAVWTVAFYEQYTTCTWPGTMPASGAFSFALPGGPPSGACWIVTIDLDGAGDAGASFTMRADGDGAAGGGTSDRFGWSITSNAAGQGTGPVIAGDPATCPEGAGTPWSTTPGPGTGISTENRFFLGPPGVYGCAWFGGIPFASFSLLLWGDACAPPQGYGPMCVGDGVAPHTACPCSNHSAPADLAGCLNSLGVGGRLRASGTASLANDTLVLWGSHMPNGTVLYFQGTAFANGGNGTVLGDGLRCAVGSVQRLGTKVNVWGGSTFGGPGDPPVHVAGMVGVAGTRTYQAWYRNVAAFCTPGGFNLTNGVEVGWN